MRADRLFLDSCEEIGRECRAWNRVGPGYEVVNVLLWLTVLCCLAKENAFPMRNIPSD